MTAAAMVRPAATVPSRLAEGPVWDERSGRLWWVDIDGRRLHRMAGVDGPVTSIDLPVRPGFLVLGRDDEVLVATERGLELLDLDSGTLSGWAALEGAQADRRANDGGCDPAGRVLAGTMRREMTPGTGRLYRFDGTAPVLLLSDLTIPNGLAWPDDGTLYYIDTPRRAIAVLSYDVSTGSVRGERRVIDVSHLDGSPDGMTLDGDGNLWVAFHGGGAVRCLSPSGDLVAEVPLGVRTPTSCAFGGPDLADLFITSERVEDQPEELAGVLLHCRPGATGRPVRRWSGPTG